MMLIQESVNFGTIKSIKNNKKQICSRCGEQLMCCDCAEGMIHIDLQDSKIN